MYNGYYCSHRLRTTDFDRWEHLQPAAVLDLFQDAAGAHAGTMALGHADMEQRGLLWVVLRVYYEQLAQPRPGDMVQVRTWPHPPGMIDCVRDYELLAADGTPLVRGMSLWAVVRAADRKLMPAREIPFPADQLREEQLFPQRLRRLQELPETDPVHTLRSGFTDLDLNGHVNNARYANYVMNALRPSQTQQLRSFRMDYHHEVLPDMALTLHTARDGDTVQCRGCAGDGTLMFSAEITLGGM